MAGNNTRMALYGPATAPRRRPPRKAAVLLALALALGIASTAAAAVPGDPFRLGVTNAINALTSLTGTVAGKLLLVTNSSTATSAVAVGASGKSPSSAAIQATNSGGGPALGLTVNSGKAPMRISAGAAKVANLDSDRLDGKDSSQFLPASVYKNYGGWTLGTDDSRTGGKKAELSCDAGDTLVNGGFYTGTVNNPNHIMGSNNYYGNTWTLEWWVPGGGSGGYVALVVTCLDTAAPAHGVSAIQNERPTLERARDR